MGEIRSATRRKLLLCSMVGVFLGLAAHAVYYGEATSYLSDDPLACVNCHVMQDHYDGWAKASHSAVATCNDCHVPSGFPAKWLSKAENGFWHSYGFTFDNFHEPIAIRPGNREALQDNCVRCHQDMVSKIVQPPSPRNDLDCLSCHASVGHGPVR